MTGGTARPGAHDYRVTGSELVFDGHVVRLRVDQVEMPGGTTAAREVAGHDDAVAVVALDEAGRVALIRQYRHPLGVRMWELPAGLCDVDGEEPEGTARRELQEETGLAAARWEPLVTIAPSPGFSDEVVRIFLARELSRVERPEAEHEEVEIELDWAPLDEAVRRCLSGDIVNGIAVSGLLAAAETLRAG